MIKDRNINYKYKTEFFPTSSFNSFVAADSISSGHAAALVEAGGDNGYSSMLMDNDLDLARLVAPIPSHWDTANDMFFRVLYVVTGGSSTVNYVFTFKQSAFGAAIAGAASVPALDTPIASDTSTGSDALDATAWGKMNGGTLLSTSDVVCIDLTANSTASNTQLVGLEVAYLPKLTDGAQNRQTNDPTNA